MALPRTIYLIRHAQSRPSDDTPEAQWPLSDRGARQAESLASLLEPLGIVEVWSSPYLRCQRTIEPFAQRAGSDVHVHDGLRERKIVHGISDDFAAICNRSWQDFDFALSGCETSAAAQARFVAAIDEIVKQTDADPLGVCSHGNVIGLFLHHVDRACGRPEAEALTNPDVLRIRFVDGRHAWDRSFGLPALSAIATHHSDTRVQRKA